MRLFILTVLICILCISLVAAPEGVVGEDLQSSESEQTLESGQEVTVTTVTQGTITSITAENVNIKSATVRFAGADYVTQNVNNAQVTGDVFKGVAGKDTKVGDYEIPEGASFEISNDGKVKFGEVFGKNFNVAGMKFNFYDYGKQSEQFGFEYTPAKPGQNAQITLKAPVRSTFEGNNFRLRQTFPPDKPGMTIEVDSQGNLVSASQQFPADDQFYLTFKDSGATMTLGKEFNFFSSNTEQDYNAKQIQNKENTNAMFYLDKAGDYRFQSNKGGRLELPGFQASSKYSIPELKWNGEFVANLQKPVPLDLSYTHHYSFDFKGETKSGNFDARVISSQDPKDPGKYNVLLGTKGLLDQSQATTPVTDKPFRFNFEGSQKITLNDKRYITTGGIESIGFLSWNSLTSDPVVDVKFLYEGQYSNADELRQAKSNGASGGPTWITNVLNKINKEGFKR